MCDDLPQGTAVAVVGKPVQGNRKFWASSGGTQPRSSYIVVAGFSPGCTVEAQDDGVHSALVQASNGARESICAPDWWIAFLPLGGFPTCGARSEYFLNSRPAPGTLEVRVDGVLVPASDWSYDAANNSVTFASGHAPRLGATITAHYVPSCTP